MHFEKYWFGYIIIVLVLLLFSDNFEKYLKTIEKTTFAEKGYVQKVVELKNGWSEVIWTKPDQPTTIEAIK